MNDLLTHFRADGELHFKGLIGSTALDTHLDFDIPEIFGGVAVGVDDFNGFDPAVVGKGDFGIC